MPRVGIGPKGEWRAGGGRECGQWRRIDHLPGTWPPYHSSPCICCIPLMDPSHPWTVGSMSGMQHIQQHASTKHPSHNLQISTTKSCASMHTHCVHVLTRWLLSHLILEASIGCMGEMPKRSHFEISHIRHTTRDAEVFQLPQRGPIHDDPLACVLRA